MIADSCPGLTYLGSYALEAVDNDSLSYLLSKCRALARVEIGGCINISRAEVSALQAQYPKVTL